MCSFDSHSYSDIPSFVVREGSGGSRAIFIPRHSALSPSPLASSPLLSPLVTGEMSSNPLDSSRISSELLAAIAAGLPHDPVS